MITEVLPAIGDEWPKVVPRLQAVLRRRGVVDGDLDDIVQDVAERVLRAQVRFTSADDLLPWATAVGSRLAVDRYRRSKSISPVPSEELDQAAGVDVATEVDARLRLAGVREVWTRLSDAERSALASGDVPAESRREAVRRNVQRHRARQHLAALVQRVVGIFAPVMAALRRLRRSKRAVTTAIALAAVVAPPVTLWLRTQTAPPPHIPAHAPNARPAARLGASAKSRAGPQLKTSNAPSTETRQSRRPSSRKPSDATLLTYFKVSVPAPGSQDEATRVEARPPRSQEPTLCIRLGHGVPDMCVG